MEGIHNQLVVSRPLFEVWLTASGKPSERAENYPMAEAIAQPYCEGFNQQAQLHSEPCGWRAVVRPISPAVESRKEVAA
jgi:hypothetical protein